VWFCCGDDGDVMCDGSMIVLYIIVMCMYVV
jgi:hypothetical protein